MIHVKKIYKIIIIIIPMADQRILSDSCWEEEIWNRKKHKKSARTRRVGNKVQDWNADSNSIEF